MISTISLEVQPGMRLALLDWLWRPLLFSLLLLLLVVPAGAATANGFVTHIDSSTEFDVGTLHVVMSGQTHCEARELPVLKMSYHLLTFNPQYPLPLFSGITKSIRLTSIACDTRKLSIGSRIHLVGFMQSGGHFAANRVVTSAEVPSKLIVNGALLEETQELQQDAMGWHGTLWLDGYQMAVTNHTKLLTAPDSTVFGVRWGSRWHRMSTIQLTHSRLSSKDVSQAFSARLLRANVCVAYHATRMTDGTITASQLRFWPNQIDANEEHYLNKFAAAVKTPNYTKNIPGTIDFKPMNLNPMNGRRTKTINVLPYLEVQDWVSRLGMEMVPEYQKQLPDTNRTKIEFTFYVVHTFRSALNHYLGVINAGGSSYEDLVVAMPNGVILIPDTALINLHNKAQLAALLSYAITSILQKHAYIAWPYVAGILSLGAYSDYGQPFAVWQNEQTLRIGIRQMYLTGYDIREAPFAWAVAQGKAVANPVINSKHPDKEIPWYAAYAFNYISQYYKDVDYSKLKRGRAEYQQFLKKLYKADPSLPRPKAPN